MPTGQSRRTALVTGGATGVGAASALMLAQRGYDVAIMYSRSAKEADETVAGCKSAGVDAIALQGDVADDAACRATVAAAAQQFGRLDALVNSAGTTQFVPLSELDGQNAADFQAVYAVNVIGPYQMARAAAPHMRQMGNGAIVHVSSVGSLNGNGSSYSYVTSKSALNALTLALARNLAPEIRVNAVLPGLIETRWLKRGLGDDAYQRVRDGWVDASALGKACTAEDVAQAIVWLVDEASLVTGQLITVDGGFLLGRPARVAR
jgi:NAD(P)-dependent dehydrogenase (short-subunit alcohol dehydrogenase family)